MSSILRIKSIICPLIQLMFVFIIILVCGGSLNGKETIDRSKGLGVLFYIEN